MAIRTVGSSFIPYTVTLGGGDLIVWAFQDSTGDMISVHENNLTFGRNSTSVTGEFLRSINGTTPTSTFGPIVPYNAKITWISASAANTPSQVIEIYSGGSSIWTDSWSAATEVWDVDLDVAQYGNISVYVGTATTPVNTPVVTIGYRWRF